MALATKKQVYRNTAYQITVLAFIFIFLAIPAGIMDWQRFYGGAWIFEIKMKLVLAAVYFGLLTTAVVIGRRHNDSPAMPVLYVSGMLTVAGLGFFGGQLVYRGFTPEAPEQFKIGRHIFESNCSGCHRRGENIIEPKLPLRNAPQLKKFDDFLNFIRDPRMPDGSPGLMPRFTSEKLTDEEAKQLFDYLYFKFIAESTLH
jgi:mono/diheme cytochrome c family protein